MPTKRCEICRKARQIEDISICCTECEDKELDLLLTVYAFIHCYDSDFCPPDVLIKNIEPIDHIKLNHNFIRSWINKRWLEKNALNALCVPPPIQESIELDGFKLTKAIRRVLIKQKEDKPKIDPSLFKDHKKSEENKKRFGMVYMQKKKGD